MSIADVSDRAERTPPHDQLAEQSVLGAMMMSPHATADALEHVRARDFYVPKHELIFDAVLRLYSHGEPTDVIAVADELLKHGELDRAGGADYIHLLTSIAPVAANAGYYASIVADRAVFRRLAEAGARIAQMGFEPNPEPLLVVEDARAIVDAVANAEAQQHALAVGDAMDSWVESIETPAKAIPTPWRDINSMIGGGLHPGRLYVVGARPGEGKSIVALMMAYAAAQHGPVAFSSLEMSRDDLMTRLVSSRARIHMTTLGARNLTPEQWTAVARVRNEIRDLPLVIDDRSEVTITGIQSHARTVSRKGHLAGVFVDYLQLVTGSRGKDRHEVVAEISRQLKIMSRNLACPVVALSQLNRESVGKGRRAPSLTDLKESGAIEQDADVVMLLQRRRDKDDNYLDELNVHIGKNRHGPTGMRTLLWEGKFARVLTPAWGVPPEFPVGD